MMIKTDVYIGNNLSTINRVKRLLVILVLGAMLLHPKASAYYPCAAIYNHLLASLPYSLHEYPPGYVFNILDVQDERSAILPVCNKFDRSIVLHIFCLCDVCEKTGLGHFDFEIFISGECDREQKVEATIT